MNVLKKPRINSKKREKDRANLLKNSLKLNMG